MTHDKRLGTDRARRVDAEHERGERGGRGSDTASAAPTDPVAHELPGAVPGNAGIDDTGARMVPPGNAAGGTTPGGTSAAGPGCRAEPRPRTTSVSPTA